MKHQIFVLYLYRFFTFVKFIYHCVDSDPCFFSYNTNYLETKGISIISY